MAAILEQAIGPERALVLADVVLVASVSCPGTWHQVQGDQCDCKGYSYRHTCRHLAVAAEARVQAEPEPARGFAPRPTDGTCRKCGRAASRLFAGQCSRCVSSLDD